VTSMCYFFSLPDQERPSPNIQHYSWYTQERNQCRNPTRICHKRTTSRTYRWTIWLFIIVVFYLLFPICYQIQLLLLPPTIDWHDISEMYNDVYNLYITVKGLDSQLYSVKEQLSDIKDKLYTYLVQKK